MAALRQRLAAVSSKTENVYNSCRRATRATNNTSKKSSDIIFRDFLLIFYSFRIFYIIPSCLVSRQFFCG